MKENVMDDDNTKFREKKIMYNTRKSRTKQVEVTRVQFRAVRQMCKKFPTVVLEFSPGLLGLYGVWHCHDEAVHLLPAGLDVISEFHPEASIELHSAIHNSHFRHSSENGLILLPENLKTQ
jgi:hypothetical protein